MKILVLGNLYPPDVTGGYELGCKQAVDALRASGHIVRVLTSRPRIPVPSDDRVARTLTLVDAWSEHAFATNAPITNYLEQSLSLRVSAVNVHALCDEIESFRPDVVYAWMLVGVGGLGLMATLQHLGVPWVWHLMDDVPLMLGRSDGKLVPGFANAMSQRLRGSYIACGRRLVDEIEQGGIMLGDRVDVLPNWVAGKPRPARRLYFEGGHLRIISAAGLIDRHADKGIDILIEAAAKLVADGRRNFSIDIHGRSTDGYASHLIHKHGLESTVNIRGSLSQTELSERFAEHDLFAFPTREREPFGFAPLEAAARGCVPLISRVCGLAEWFVHGVHVLKAERSAEAFADGIAAIQDRRVDLGTIGKRVANVVGREFHIDAILPKIETILEDASRRPRVSLGSAQDAYRLALLAEKLSRTMIQEARCA